MTEDKSTHHEFLQIVNGSFSVSERELLNSLFDTVATIRSKHSLTARRWASKNLPEYLRDDDMEIERTDALKFAVVGFFSFAFVDTYVRIHNILEEMLTELTEADNDADIPTPEND